MTALNELLSGWLPRQRWFATKGHRARLVSDRSVTLTRTADLVVTNPPFVEAGEAPPSPEPLRRAAHELPPGGFAAWIRAAADALAHRGRLALIQRADRLEACLAALRPAFGSLSIRPVHPRADVPASRVLLSAVRGGRAPATLLPGLVLHDPDGRFTPLAEALHRGEVLAG